METSQNIRKGARSGRSTRPEPQSDWDSFLLTAGIPKDPKGDFPLPVETMISHRAEAGVEEVAQEGRTLEALSPQQQIPQRRGRPRKNKEAGETRVPNEPRAKISCRRITYARYSAGTCRRYKSRKLEQNKEDRYRRSTNVREPSQQLKQAQLAIAELYQENRELRQQLAAKTLEVSASQGHEGNMTWLKRQLREAQDTIIQLHETQRLSEERNASISENVKRSRRKSAQALASTQKKHD
jgi:hypothetical protein